MVKWLAALFRLAFPDREDFTVKAPEKTAPIPNGHVHDIVNRRPAVNKLADLATEAKKRRRKVGKVTQDAE